MGTIVQAESDADIREARALFLEYAGTLDFNLCFQGFDEELARLPGCYAPPSGRLLLALVEGVVAGCIGLRDLGGGACEMKRLYVRPAYRSLRLGRLLAETAIAHARAVGYARMRLDTLPSMGAARSLYDDLGFTDVPPYYHNPVEGAEYKELDLRNAPEVGEMSEPVTA